MQVQNPFIIANTSYESMSWNRSSTDLFWLDTSQYQIPHPSFSAASTDDGTQKCPEHLLMILKSRSEAAPLSVHVSGCLILGCSSDVLLLDNNILVKHPIRTPSVNVTLQSFAAEWVRRWMKNLSPIQYHYVSWMKGVSFLLHHGSSPHLINHTHLSSFNN